MNEYGGMLLTGETKELGKICRSAALSATNHTWTSPGSNQGVHIERVVAFYLCHGSVQIITEACLLS